MPRLLPLLAVLIAYMAVPLSTARTEERACGRHGAAPPPVFGSAQWCRHGRMQMLRYSVWYNVSK